MRTKIVATLGPATEGYGKLKALAQNGVRIFRLNFSHAQPASFAQAIKDIRGLENELGLPLTVMGDLCGAKIRIGEIKGSPRTVNKDQIVCLGLPDTEAAADRDLVFIGLNHPELLMGLEPEMPVSLSDGMLQFKVSRVVKRDKLFEMTAQNDGLLSSHKGIAFPGKFHPMPAMTEKDKRDLHEGLDLGLNAVALSFVQTKDDVLDLKAEIKRHGRAVPVVSKLERKNALDNLESILAATDVVMVARGDLGLECPLSYLPIIQKQIIRACRHAQKASIVATQMLLSMVKNPVPTRAEATDVANAILDGADCVMLSEETAVGSYPIEAVKLISEIAGRTESYFLERLNGPYAPKNKQNVIKYLTYAACLLAENTDSAALASHTLSGSTVRMLSSRRPSQTIFGLTPYPDVLRALNFFWGVEPRLVEESASGHMELVQKFIQNEPRFTPKQSVVICSGEPTPGQESAFINAIKIYYKG